LIAGWAAGILRVVQREQTIDRAKAAAAGLFLSAGVLAAYAFGSRIAGRARPDSDLDVGYYLLGYRRRDRLPLEAELRLSGELSEAIGLEVDMRNLAEAPLELRGLVLVNGVRIFSGDDVARVELERELLARYHDYREEFRQMHELRLRRMAESGF